jgi:RNA polymerase sigma factor (sigma-70 family)
MKSSLVRLALFTTDLPREPDGRLLDAFLTGCQPAFRELVARHGRLVFAVCNQVLRHQQDAEDAFQATFLVLARRAADVWPRDAVGSWLYGVAYRVALKARTARSRRLARERPLDDVPQPAHPTPEPDTAEVVHRAVRNLPEVYRAAVVACDLEGLSRKAAAEQLGWSEGTLSGRLARARQLLAARLRKAGLAPASGVAIVLGTLPAVRAGLVERTLGVAFATAAAGVPAPVAALSEGVVPVMMAKKLQTAAAVVLVACSLGVGAWAAGNGDGPAGAGGGTAAQPTGAKGAEKQSPAAVQPPAKPPAGAKWVVEGVDLTPAEERRNLVFQELQLMVVQDQVRKPTDSIEQFREQLERDRGNLAALLGKLDEAQAEFEMEKERARATAQKPGTRRPPTNPAVEAAEREVKQARASVEESRAEYERARVLLELAKARFHLATQRLHAEEHRLKAAFDDLRAKQPQPAGRDDAAFTVHVRPLTAAEQVVRVKATGSHTVLDGLLHAAGVMTIKADELSVWVVRDQKVLPVDLPGILQRGVTTTNYQLVAGDQLFVQVKVGK